jgi:hypothetical protein
MDEKRRFELLSKGIEAGVTVIQTVMWTAALIAVAYFGEKVLIAFAGKTTSADVSFSLLTKLQSDRWFAYLFGFGGMSYGYAERKLRQRNIKRMSAVNVDLEKRLDPRRTSSGLTPTGTTRTEDR